MNEKLCPKCKNVVLPKTNFIGMERCPHCRTSLDHVAWVSAQSPTTASVNGAGPSSVKEHGRRFGFGPIRSRADALKMIRDVGISFLILAVIQSVIFAFTMKSALVDTIMMAVLALLLWWLKSRVVAILLLVFSIAEGIATVLTFVGIANLGGKNVWLAALIVWAAVKSVEATFKLHGKYAEPVAALDSNLPAPAGDSRTEDGGQQCIR